MLVVVVELRDCISVNSCFGSVLAKAFSVDVE